MALGDDQGTFHPMTVRMVLCHDVETNLVGCIFQTERLHSSKLI